MRRRREEYRLTCFVPEMSLYVNVLNSETNYGGFSNTADFLYTQLYLEGVINSIALTARVTSLPRSFTMVSVSLKLLGELKR